MKPSIMKALRLLLLMIFQLLIMKTLLIYITQFLEKKGKV